MSRDQRYRRRERLRLRRDFARVFADKCTAGDDVLAVYVSRNGLAWSRLGISVGKRMGNAVQRNYVRRRIREAFRKNKADLPGSLDIICIARARASDRRTDIAKSLRTLTARAAERCEDRLRAEGE